MFGTLLGLPAHPLFVHFAVGLIPLTALLTAWSGWLSPARRRVVALPLVLLNVLTLVVAFVTKESGENLEHRMPREALIEAHAGLGDLLPLFAGLMLLTSVALWWLARRGVPEVGTHHAASSETDAPHGAHPVAAGRRSGLQTAVAAATLLLALLTCWWTFRVGHSGAESVWKDVPLAPASQGEHSD